MRACVRALGVYMVEKCIPRQVNLAAELLVVPESEWNAEPTANGIAQKT